VVQQDTCVIKPACRHACVRPIQPVVPLMGPATTCQDLGARPDGGVPVDQVGVQDMFVITPVWPLVCVHPTHPVTPLMVLAMTSRVLGVWLDGGVQEETVVRDIYAIKLV